MALPTVHFRTHMQTHDVLFPLLSVGMRTLTVLKVGKSMELWEFVSRVTTQNSLRGVGVESKPSFCNNPWFKSMVL